MKQQSAYSILMAPFDAILRHRYYRDCDRPLMDQVVQFYERDIHLLDGPRFPYANYHRSDAPFPSTASDFSLHAFVDCFHTGGILDFINLIQKKKINCNKNFNQGHFLLALNSPEPYTYKSLIAKQEGKEKMWNRET